MKNNILIYAGIGVALYFLLKKKSSDTKGQEIKNISPGQTTSPEIIEKIAKDLIPKTAPAPAVPTRLQANVMKPIVPIINYAIPVSQEYNAANFVSNSNMQKADEIVTKAVSNFTFTAEPTLEAYSKTEAKKDITFC